LNPPISQGNGNENNPYQSLYYAFTKVYASFTKILLPPGDYHYLVDLGQVLYLRADHYDPLNFKSFRIISELWIVGTDPNNISVVYWHDMLKITPNAQKVYIKNIKFTGEYILRTDCDGSTDYCYYCPNLFSYRSLSSYLFFLSDKIIQVTKNIFNNSPANCSLYHDQILFNLTNPTFIENVHFYGFRQQFLYLIHSSSSLNIANVTFKKNQPRSGGSVI
jgi:hypothetical protein